MQRRNCTLQRLFQKPKCKGCQSANRAAHSKYPRLCDVPQAKERFDNEYFEKSEYNLGEGYTKDSVSKLTTASNKVIEWKCKKHNKIY